MTLEPITDLLERLNTVDECTAIEAKKGTAIHKSVMETVCAFSNEPGLGGGYIVLGIERDEASLFPQYVVCGVSDPDKLQLDFATQCASMFNMPVRPDIEVEALPDGKLVLKAWVTELPPAQKPLYFKAEGLPAGACRRIASSDQRCTDDDLFVFYNREDTLDSSIVKGASLDDISEEAITLYRELRKNVNEFAEELSYNDRDLLQALGCLKKEGGEQHLTYAGLLLFGKRQAQRRLLPMMRVDYIRVPGNEWVADPENRFKTVDMRGPLPELVQRIFSAVSDDLPKGFLLPEGQLQAENVGLPARVLREAIVNALMHRTYRENQPVQLIRYGNRLEIKNPGFSLKPQDQLGEPGSKNRNPYIAAVFHETNLAETKGSGIRTMRLLMQRAGMIPPTFESDHSTNTFTARLLLHHFLSEGDLIWLDQYRAFDMTAAQKMGLIWLREVGALDNPTYRQLNGCDTLKAGVELRQMRDWELLRQKGTGRYTYYIPGAAFAQREEATGITLSLSGKPGPLSGESKALSGKFDPLSGKPEALSGEFHSLSGNLSPLSGELPENLRERLRQLGKRSTPDKIKSLICDLCSVKPFNLKELSLLMGRTPDYLHEYYITALKQEGRLQYSIPEMPNHPQQAYITVNSGQ